MTLCEGIGPLYVIGWLEWIGCIKLNGPTAYGTLTPGTKS